MTAPDSRRTYNADFEVRVSVQINDRNVIDRCVDNELSTNGKGETHGWRDYFYPLDTEEKVIEHLAYNAVANGCDDLSGLDGWADLPADAATMRVQHVEHLETWEDGR